MAGLGVSAAGAESAIGVAEFAKRYYGQLSENPWDTSGSRDHLARPRWQSARVLADLYSPQNLFLIARKNT